MIELEVHNFQSIRHATMAVNGFAAIVGRSNIGKSAIVRAAQIALTGAIGTDFVRHGQECDRKIRGTKKCKCSSKVVIRTQAMDLTWEKGDSINRYTLLRTGEETPVVYNNLDRGTPEFLREGFLPVKIGDARELIQIPDQFEPIFLLNKTGTVVADVLSDVARLDNINRAMADANKDRKDASAKRKVRLEDITQLQKDLSFYDGLDAIVVEPLIRIRKDLEVKSRQLEQVNGFLARLGSLKTSLASLGEALKPELPNGDALESKGARLTQVTSFLNDLTEKVPVFRTLTALDQATLPDESPLSVAHTNLTRADVFSRRLALLETTQVKLAAVDKTVIPEENLNPALAVLEKTDHWWRRWTSAEVEIAKIPTLSELPEVDDLRQKVEDYTRYYRMLDNAKTLAETIKNTQEHLKTAEAEEAKALADLEALGMCPTCDQPVGSNHRLHMEAV